MPLGGDEAAGLAGQRREAAVVVLDDVGMDRLVGEIDEERRVARPIDEALDVVGEQVGGVALGLHPLCRRRSATGRWPRPVPASPPSGRSPGAGCRRCPCATCRRSRCGSRPAAGRAGTPAGRWLSRAVLSMMPLVCGYWPVRKLARLGEHSGVVAKALVKRAPSRGEPIHVRRLDERMAGGAQVVPAHVVDQHEHQVGPPWRRRGRLPVLGRRAARCAEQRRDQRQDAGRAGHRREAMYGDGHEGRYVTLTVRCRAELQLRHEASGSRAELQLRREAGLRPALRAPPYARRRVTARITRRRCTTKGRASSRAGSRSVGR